MADFAFQRETRTHGEIMGRVFVAGNEADFIFGKGTQIFPNIPVDIWGRTYARVVADAGEKWFEMGFRMDHPLFGNPAAGWTDQGDYFRIDYQWSPDLVNWSMGKFIAAPTPVVNLGDGTYEYWARALHPQDAAVKNGALVCGQTNGDARNNGFTSIFIAGVAQALPHFPYDMAVAGTAAQLQADLIAIGWAGCVVTGTTAATWSISIPSVNYTDYAQSSYVGFPSYSYTDAATGETNTISRLDFRGSFVDAAGTSIFNKAFGRLKFSRGTRYT